MYLIKILLNDQRDIVTYNFSVFVVDLPPEPVIIKEEEPIQEDTIDTPGKNETSTSVEDMEELQDDPKEQIEGELIDESMPIE